MAKAKEARVNIGCKLPHGLALEVGLDPKTGQPTDDYRCVVLQGMLKAPKGAKYGSTLVPVGVWEPWLKVNTELRYVVDGSVFVIT
jgi:hypothetical protein